MLLNEIHRSMEFMGLDWSLKSPNEWKQVTMQWASFNKFSNAVERVIIDMVNV